MGKTTEMETAETSEEIPLFSERMKRAHNLFLSKNWRAFKEIFEEDEKDLLKDIDLHKNIAISVSTHSNNHILLRDLLEMIPEEDRWVALRRKNCQDNTLLHEIALQEAVEMVDVVLELEKKAVPPPERGEPLLEMKNQKGETPLFRAAKFGNLKMVKQMAKHVAGDDDVKVHLYNNKQNILHASVRGQFFDLALWIMRRMDGNTLALEKTKSGLTCLQILSRMPDVFRSHYPMGSLKSLLYYLLPDEGYEVQGYDDFELFRRKSDLESGQQDDAKPPKSDLSRINYAFWKYLAKVFKGVDDLRREKNKHKLSERLTESLVKNDYSWQKSHNHLGKTTVKLSPIVYNVPQRKKRLEYEKKIRHFHLLEDERDKKKQHLQKGPEDDKAKTKKDRYYHYIPLLIAASYGIIKIIEIFLKEHPQAIEHVSEDGQNVLHMAVKHRQLEIFKLLKKNPKFDALTSQITTVRKRTILHQIARMEFYRAPSLPGAAFQLQSELKWYKRVEKVTPSLYLAHCDRQYLTAGDLLDIEHDDMLKDAQTWIKDTSQSCSTVAVLVATVVFAAAYTIPGGSEAGTPVLLRSPVFLFFTVMDIVALALSLASVVMFLSILTSPFELWDFHKSLPTRLRIGFAFLFCSLTTTMLAFIATILLTIPLQWKQWTSTLVYGAAFFPVTIFSLIEFPLYMMLPNLLAKMFKKLMKVAPINRVIKCLSNRRVDKTKYP